MTGANSLVKGASMAFDLAGTSFSWFRSRAIDYDEISMALSVASGETAALATAGIASQMFRVIAADEVARLVDADQDVKYRFGYVSYERSDLGSASLIAIPTRVMKGIQRQLWNAGFPTDSWYLEVLTRNVARYLRDRSYHLASDEIEYLLRIISFSRAIRARDAVVHDAERALRTRSNATHIA